MTEAVLEKEPVEIKFEDDPLFSVIVPVYDIKTDVLKRCLKSISEQNYDNLEVVLVFDGPNKDLKEVADFYAKDKENWKILEVEHAGACAARNAGFYASTGEIVSFINSDYILKPGIIRLWVDRLQENPDCGFVYGSYEYNTSVSQWYPSKPFDKDLLEVANYIDCGFPLWRKYFVNWDVNCKSLQDWDFWLRVVKEHKVKGYYLKDISFIAEPPRPKGLSDDSSSHWVDRVKYVKEKNGIPIRELCVTSLGAANHGIEIAKMLKADFRDDTIHKPHEYKGVYMIGFYIKPSDSNNEHGPILSRFPNSTRIVHWVGADIFWLRKFTYENLKSLGGALKLSALHLVESEKEQKQLKDLLGLDSEIVPIPPYNDYQVEPLPKDFKVAVFLTQKSDFDKYLTEHTLSIVRACPNIKFTAYGDYATKDIQYPNLECFGNLSKEEWKKYVLNNSALLRIVRHDTTPLASNEFMMAGRYVISNIPGECTHYINTAGDSEINKWDLMAPGLNAYNWPKTKKKIIQTIRELRKLDGPYFDPKINERFSREKYINKIYELLKIERPK